MPDILTALPLNRPMVVVVRIAPGRTVSFEGMLTEKAPNVRIATQYAIYTIPATDVLDVFVPTWTCGDPI